MQEIIGVMLRRLIDEGHTPAEISLYLRGVFECMSIVSTSVKESKMKNPGKDTDPLYVHTWNHVVENLSELLETSAEEAIENLPKGFEGVINDNFPK